MPNGPGTAPDLYQEAFQRNIGLIGESEQAALRRARVAVAGVGGVGGLHLLALARIGIGRFHLADLDTFEVSNFNRQFGATIETVGQPKVEVMARMVKSINPSAEIVLFPVGVQPTNVLQFLTGVDVVVDGIDFFAYDHRRLLFNAAREGGIHVITSGPIGYGSTLQVFSPSGMSFDSYFGIHDTSTDLEKFAAFAVGIAPKVLHRRYMDLSKVRRSAAQGPVVAPACMICSGLVAAEAVNVVLRRRPIKAVPYYFQFDPYLQVYRKGYLWGGSRHPLQRLKRWWLKRRMIALEARQEADALGVLGAR